VLLIISKIYFLYKNILVAISMFNILIFPNSLSINNQIKANENLTTTNIIKGEKINITIRIIPEIEQVMRGYGLVDISDLDSNIIINLQYATTNNFLGINIYDNLTHAYLQKEVAEKLINASNDLIKIMPNYRIVILDAARPLSIQKKMWDKAQIPQEMKEKYLANPIYGSLHNYGAAVDVTLADTLGNFLDMGTNFDSFENIAYPLFEQDFIKSGKLNPTQVNNRLILRSVMKLAGFSSISTEWWHFNSCSREFAKKNYPLIVSHILAENPQLNVNEKIKNSPKLKEPKVNNINFRVQIMTSATKLNRANKIFKGNDVDEYFHNGLYKFTVGKFNTLEDAFRQLKQAQNMGFNDAFIVAFNKNQRIGIKDASELIE